MGLMHVGVGEGPEVIQTFGRGVRLKGWNMSLKRHRRTGVEPPGDSDDLAELERLYVFGLRSSYMQTFRDLLDKEGVRIERETIRLPVTWNFEKKTDLKMVRLATDRKYEHSGDRLVLPGPRDEGSPPRGARSLLAAAVRGVGRRCRRRGPGGEGAGKSLVKLKPDHAAFFDRTRIHHKLLRRKRQRGWHNLVIEPETVGRLLSDEDQDWYELYAPPERLSVTGFPQLRTLEDVAVDLLTEYAEQFWRRERRKWEHDRIEVVTLGEDDPNRIDAWELSADVAETHLVEDLRRLASHVQEGWFSRLKIGVVMANAHAYEPLLYAGKDCQVTVRPVPLDENERKVVEGLADLAENGDPCLQGPGAVHDPQPDPGARRVVLRRLPLLPRLFIVWLKDGERQHVVFLDPKGLRRFGDRERRKVELHHGIAEVEEQVRSCRSEPAFCARMCCPSPHPRSSTTAGAPRRSGSGTGCTSWRTPTASAK